jgi:hypothetical protein
MFTPAQKAVIQANMIATKTDWTDSDNAAYETIKGKIIEAGKKLRLITYSELVSGVKFNLPNLISDYQICVWDWKDMDRSMIGGFLARISTETFSQYNFMASSLVVLRDPQGHVRPSQHFFEWMVAVGAIPDDDEETVMVFWSEQVNRAHNFYRHGTIL